MSRNIVSWTLKNTKKKATSTRLPHVGIYVPAMLLFYWFIQLLPLRLPFEPNRDHHGSGQVLCTYMLDTTCPPIPQVPPEIIRITEHLRSMPVLEQTGSFRKIPWVSMGFYEILCSRLLSAPGDSYNILCFYHVYVLNGIPNGRYTLPAGADRPYRPWCSPAWAVQPII